jgi:alpha-1,3/alpha-1,6-mannosyltransferase
VEERLRIVFLHPTLGIGGAERLVIDAALALRSRGHAVRIYTTHHDPARCFDETRDGSLDIRVHGALLPIHVGNRLRAPIAIARMHWAAWALARRESADVVFVDLVAHVVPWVRWLARAPVVFYCHYPDHLLSPPRRGLYALYRVPIDRWEELGTGAADRVLVNSRFTAAAFRRAFPRLHAIEPEVLHPSVGVARRGFDDGASRPAERVFVALHRFEPAKNVALAIDSLAELRKLLPASLFASVRLVIAGGYDERLRENRETLAALETQTAKLGLGSQISFRPSLAEAERLALLSSCVAVLYTAEHEHFGYVPLEAMAASRPVIAVDSGGPRETVLDGVTGHLCLPRAAEFAARMARLLLDPVLADEMGREGRDHVSEHFSREAFAGRLDRIVREVAAGARAAGRR